MFRMMLLMKSISAVYRTCVLREAYCTILCMYRECNEKNLATKKFLGLIVAKRLHQVVIYILLIDSSLLSIDSSQTALLWLNT